MKYFAFDLNSALVYHHSGKSVNDTPMKHISRVLDDYELFYVSDGELNIEQEEEYSVKKNQIVFHEKGIRQRGTKLSCNAFYWLHVDGNIFTFNNESDAEDFCKKGNNRVYFAQTFSLTEPERITFFLTQLNHYAFERDKDLVKNHLATALFSELAAQYLKLTENYSVNVRFSQILYYIGLHLSEQINVGVLAEKFFYNPRYLCRLFSKYTGETPINYINGKRLEYAAHLLVATSDTIKQIATVVGFSDEYYFMRLFKKRYGVTPKTYRNTFSGCRYT